MKTAALILALIATGCTTREFYYHGASYTHRSFGTRQSIGELTVTASSNAVTFKIRGYNSDQVEALGVVAERAAAGAVKGLGQ